MKFTFKEHGADKNKEKITFSLGFGNYSKIVSVSVEQGKEYLAKQKAEEARKEEAARFNRFRRK